MTGTAPASISKSTPDARAIPAAWPSRPNPVTSVAPAAPASKAARAASRLDRIMVSVARSTAASGAEPCLMAVAITPMPNGLDRIRRSPGRRPALMSIRLGSTSPTTAIPYLGSGSSMVWPPATTNPSARAASSPPASTSASRSRDSSAVFQATKFRASRGLPPMA